MNIKAINIKSNLPSPVLKYIFLKDGAELVLSTLFSGADDLKACSKEMLARIAMGKGKAKLAHIILSGHASDKISNQQWAAITESVIEHYGCSLANRAGSKGSPKQSNVLAVAAKHNDREHAHTHLLLVMVGPDGKMFNRSMERVHLRQIARDFESKWGITQTPLFSDSPSRFSKPEIEKGHRLCMEGKKLTPCPERMDLKAQLEALVPMTGSFDELEATLKTKGITVSYRLNSTGQRCGISFANGDIRITGKNAGFNFRELEKIYGSETNEINGIRNDCRVATAPSAIGQGYRQGVGANNPIGARPPQRTARRAEHSSWDNRTATREQHESDSGLLAASQSLLRLIIGGTKRNDPLLLILSIVLKGMVSLTRENGRSMRPERHKPFNL